MIEVYWLEQADADVPPEDHWLSAREAARGNAMRFAKRRADWRLGRWTAKHALARWLGVPVRTSTLVGIEILPAPSGAPEVVFANQSRGVTISLSHRAGRAMCAISESGVAVGCDLETIEERSGAFIADYFTLEEQELIARASPLDRPWLATLLWSAKESVLKALRVGLRADTRCVVVRPVEGTFSPGTWNPMHLHCNGSEIVCGWWQQTDDFLRTVVSAPPPAPPVSLRILAEQPHGL